MRSAEWSARPSSVNAGSCDRTLLFNSAFHTPHSALGWGGGRWTGEGGGGRRRGFYRSRRPHGRRGDRRDRKSGVEGKRGELGGRRIIKKKKKKIRRRM